MSDDGSDDQSIDDILEPYEVSGGENYIISSSDLGPQFYKIDDYLSGFSGEAYVELAEQGFLNYHNKGCIEKEDEVVVYAETEKLEFDGETVTVGDNTEIILGRRHSESVPVEFVEGKNPFRSYRLFMPTHESVNQELKSL